LVGIGDERGQFVRQGGVAGEQFLPVGRLPGFGGTQELGDDAIQALLARHRATLFPQAIERRFQRLLAGHVPLVPAEVTHGVDQVPRQDLPQPGRPFAVVVPAKLVTCLVRLEQRLLDDVRGIELAPQPRVQVQPRQQVQVGAKFAPGPDRRNPTRGSLASPMDIETVRGPIVRAIGIFRDRANPADLR
jgi:hypothetical protein